VLPMREGESAELLEVGERKLVHEFLARVVVAGQGPEVLVRLHGGGGNPLRSATSWSSSSGSTMFRTTMHRRELGQSPCVQYVGGDSV
jgi:hypothetical protein